MLAPRIFTCISRILTEPSSASHLLSPSKVVAQLAQLINALPSMTSTLATAAIPGTAAIMTQIAKPISAEVLAIFIISESREELALLVIKLARPASVSSM